MQDAEIARMTGNLWKPSSTHKYHRSCFLHINQAWRCPLAFVLLDKAALCRGSTLALPPSL
jgi:hypothetical protein